MYLLKKSCTYILLRIKNDVNRKSLICAVNEWFLSMCCINLDRLWVKKPCNYWRVWLTLCSHSRNWSRNIIVNFFFARWPLTYQYNVKKGFCTHGVLRPNINSFFFWEEGGHFLRLLDKICNFKHWVRLFQTVTNLKQNIMQHLFCGTVAAILAHILYLNLHFLIMISSRDMLKLITLLCWILILIIEIEENFTYL